MQGEKVVLYEVTTALWIDVSYLKDYTPFLFLENVHLPGVLLRFNQGLLYFQGGHLLDFDRKNSKATYPIWNKDKQVYNLFILTFATVNTSREATIPHASM